MNVLLTNDDGIRAEGLWALYKQIAKNHIVTVIAPDRERSAVGHAITLDRPLRAKRVALHNGMMGYAVTGTPADCIKLGIYEILEDRPDMVVAGINRGANLGINVNYSGTVAAAKEAALYGIIGMSVSIGSRATQRFDEAAAFVAEFAETVFKKGLPVGTFLNVNIPDTSLNKIAGVRVSRLSLEFFSDKFDKRIDPRDNIYYWQGPDNQRFEQNLDVDGSALLENFITITPIKCDMTDYHMLEDMKKWDLDATVRRRGEAS